jgi:nicotinate-nucleotide adenylyltransferase
MAEQTSGGRRVAFFGGSFDPPHLGHLAVARAAQAALGLDTVLFAPVGAQPLKPLGSTASYEDRLALTRLAIAGDAGFAVSLADAPKAGGAPNYTLDTLEDLREDLPRGSALFCLMGADSFFGLRRWHGAAEIPFVAPLIVASRPGQLLDGLKAALPEGLSLEAGPDEDRTVAGVEMRTCILRNAAGQTSPFYLLPGLNVEISASDIRAGISAAMDGQGGCRELLPDAVFEAIRSRGLYR